MQDETEIFSTGSKHPRNFPAIKARRKVLIAGLKEFGEPAPVEALMKNQTIAATYQHYSSFTLYDDLSGFLTRGIVKRTKVYNPYCGRRTWGYCLARTPVSKPEKVAELSITDAAQPSLSNVGMRIEKALVGLNEVVDAPPAPAPAKRKFSVDLSKLTDTGMFNVTTDDYDLDVKV